MANHAPPSFQEAYDQDAADLIDPDDAIIDDLDDLDPLTTNTHNPGPSASMSKPPPSTSSQNSAPTLQGSITSAPTPQQTSQTQTYLTSSIPGEDRRAPLSTIDETVWATLSRDLVGVWEKMKQVLWPRYLLGGSMMREYDRAPNAEGETTSQSGATGLRTLGQNIIGAVRRGVDADAVLQGGMSEGLRNWDLWGPLLFCLVLSFLLSRGAKDDQKNAVFSGVFVIVWLGEAVVTLQIKLLGGNISFFQSVCIIGYTLFPLVVAAALSLISLHMAVRIPIYVVLTAWSIAAGTSILGGSGVVKNRVSLAIYPLIVFYVGLGCLCFIS